MIGRMFHALPGLGRRLRQDEGGSATMEFVIAVPVMLTIFMASFESGLFMVRHVVLEQALDHTMRELRLGHIANPDADKLKAAICDRASILEDCEANIKVELTPVNTATFAIPTNPVTCRDRAAAMNPNPPFVPGGSSEPMLVRICVVQDPMFPMTGLGLRLPKDGQGGYGLVAMSVFANEPT